MDGQDQTYFKVLQNALKSEYELIEKIGEGGMASVYKARQLKLDRIEALKIIHPNLVHDKQFVNRFLQEARLAANLSHPSIVTIYTVNSIGDLYYIAMEYLEGGNLEEHIQQKGKLNIDESIAIVSEIALALEEAHSQGIIHRDIKSSNIILRKGSKPVLTDFGIAKASHGLNLTSAGAVLGSTRFMSPEQIEGKILDKRTDIFSLGIVLYHCLTGELPFNGPSNTAIMYNVVHQKPVQPIEMDNDLPSRLNTIVIKCISKKPDDRFSSCNELYLQLNEKENKTRVEVPLSGSGNTTAKIPLPPSPNTPIEGNNGSDNPKKKKGISIVYIVIPLIAVGIIIAMWKFGVYKDISKVEFTIDEAINEINANMVFVKGGTFEMGGHLNKTMCRKMNTFILSRSVIII